MNESEQTRKMTREMVEKVKAHLGGTILMLDIGMEQTAVSLYQLCNLALDGLKDPEKVQLPEPRPHADVAPVRQISNNPKILDAEVLQALLSNPRTHNILKGMAHEIATQDVRATSHPMYCVRDVRVRGYIPDDHGAFWVRENTGDTLNAGPVLELLTKKQEEYGGTDYTVVFEDETSQPVRAYPGYGRGRFDDDNDRLADSEYSQFYFRASKRTETVVVTTFFTNKSAETYIEENRHNLHDPHVYVDSGYRNYEWQFMRALIVALGRSL